LWPRRPTLREINWSITGGAGNADPVPTATEVVAVEGGVVSVPADLALLHADFARVGDDLIARDEGGHVVVAEGFFAAGELPDLVAGGGVRLDGALVARLADDVSTIVAQAGANDAGEAIGAVETASGEVFATRPDGTRVRLEVGSEVFQGDIIETGSGGEVALVFVDGTSFSMADDARMVLDELIYDPESGAGSQTFSVLTGVFAFVSGEISANNPGEAEINTPVATIGIRGTSLVFSIASDGGLNVALQPDSDGTVGSVDITGAFGSFVLQEVGQVLSQAAPDTPPTVVSLDQPALFNLFGDELGRRVFQAAQEAQSRFLGRQQNDNGDDGEEGDENSGDGEQDGEGGDEDGEDESGGNQDSDAGEGENDLLEVVEGDVEGDEDDGDGDGDGDNVVPDGDGDDDDVAPDGDGDGDCEDSPVDLAESIVTGIGRV